MRKTASGGPSVATSVDGVQGEVPAGPSRPEHQAGTPAAPAVEETGKGEAPPAQLLLERPREQSRHEREWHEKDRARFHAELGVVSNDEPVDGHGDEGDGYRTAERQRVPPRIHAPLHQGAKETANAPPALVPPSTAHRQGHRRLRHRRRGRDPLPRAHPGLMAERDPRARRGLLRLARLLSSLRSSSGCAHPDRGIGSSERRCRWDGRGKEDLTTTGCAGRFRRI